MIHRSPFSSLFAVEDPADWHRDQTAFNPAGVLLKLLSCCCLRNSDGNVKKYIYIKKIYKSVDFRQPTGQKQSEGDGGA